MKNRLIKSKDFEVKTRNGNLEEDYFFELKAKANAQLFDCAIDFLKKNDHISYESAFATFELLLGQAYHLKEKRGNQIKH